MPHLDRYNKYAPIESIGSDGTLERLPATGSEGLLAEGVGNKPSIDCVCSISDGPMS